MFPCRLCKTQFPKLAKAHIIPRSFYKRIRQLEKYSVMLSAGYERVTERAYQSGLWDDGIVCEGCEKKFSPYDDHAYDVLKSVMTCPVFENPPGEPLAYLLQGVDYHKLKLFFLSVLWRAEWARDAFFSNICLGPHEPIIADFIKNDVAPAPDEYAVYLYHLTGQRYPNTLLPPWQHRVAGTNVYRFYFPDFVALLVVDKRSLPESWKHFRLNEAPPHNLAWFPYRRSAEEDYLERMKRVIQTTKTNSKRHRRESA